MSLSRPTLFAVLLLLAACAAPPPTAAPPRAVRTAAVGVKPLSRAARYAGTVEARAQVELAFRVPGRVASVAQVTMPEGGARALQEGDPVKAGATLASLDLDDLRRQDRAAQAGAAAGAAQVESARTALAQAEREAGRARKLAASADVSPAELDRAESAATAARSALAAAEAQARTRVEQAELSHSAAVDATLKSPIDGVVARKTIDPGELVPPNAPAFSIVDVSELRLVFGVPDTRVNAVRSGQLVPVTLEALPGRRLQGTVEKVAPTADPSLRTYAVELRLPVDPALRPGMTATVLLDEGAGSLSPVVPLGAVVRAPAGKGYGVFTVGEGDRAAWAPVELGDLLENDVVLTSGLDAGARVIVEGAQFLRAGDRVGVVP